MMIRALPMRDAFLKRIHCAMAEDERIFFVSADFGSPVLDSIRADHPNRFANVGVAEQNLINISSGLALEGYKVFAYAIAPFITMRCYEQIRVNLALLSEVRPLNVTLIGVGAGYSYVMSGPTHQCYEDLSIMRALPNMGIFSPCDHVSTAALFDSCVSRSGIKYMRLDAQVLPVLYSATQPDIARGFSMMSTGTEVGIAMLATGYMVHTALVAAERLRTEGLPVTVIDLFNITGFNASALRRILQDAAGIVTLEEGFFGRGGVDAMMFNFIARHGVHKPLLNLGVEGGYRFELGTRAELHELVGIGLQAVTEKIRAFAEPLQIKRQTTMSAVS